MRTLLVMLVFSGIAMAQEQGRFYGRWFSERSAKTPQLVDTEKLLPPKLARRPIIAPRVRELASSRVVSGPPAATSVCSVPLIEAPIPNDVEFTVRQIVPRAEAVAPMPTARVPAPPCD